MAAVPDWSDGLYPTVASNYLPLLHSAPIGIQHFPGQHAAYTIPIPLRCSAPHPDLGIEETQRASHCIQHEQLLDLSLAGRSGDSPSKCQPLGPVCAAQWPSLIPILSRYSRRMERNELELSTHSCSLGSFLQHVRAVRQHHRIKHLPKR